MARKLGGYPLDLDPRKLLYAGEKENRRGIGERELKILTDHGIAVNLADVML